MSESFKITIFFGVFILLLDIYIAIYGSHYLGYSGFTINVLSMINSSVPIILSDLTNAQEFSPEIIIGELTPALLAGFMAATVPASSRNYILIIAFGLAVIVYFSYIHLSVLIKTDAINFLLDTNDIDPNIAIPILSSFTSSARTFSLIVAAALIGLKINFKPKAN